MIESAGVIITPHLAKDIAHSFLLLLQPDGKGSLDSGSNQNEVDMNAGRGGLKIMKMKQGRCF